MKYRLKWIEDDKKAQLYSVQTVRRMMKAQRLNKQTEKIKEKLNPQQHYKKMRRRVEKISWLAHGRRAAAQRRPAPAAEGAFERLVTGLQQRDVRRRSP